MSKPDINDIAIYLLDKLNRFDVIETGCWIHQHATVRGGYVNLQYTFNKVEYGYRAHRVSYVIHKGPIPEGMLVCHVCDIPNCINPNHLFLGTAKDNMQDKVNKKRANGYAPQLTEDEEGFIIVLHRRGWSSTKIGRQLGIHPTTIRKVLRINNE